MKRNREASAPHTRPPRPARAASRGAHPDATLWTRAGGSRGVARQTPRPAEQTPRPLRLSSGPADGAPGTNFTGKEEAT